VAAWLSSFIASDMLAGALGFLLVLVSVSALASLVASLLRLFVGLLFLGWLDHVLGGVLGFIQAVLICATILLVAITFPLPAWQTAVDQSHLADPVLRIGWLLLPLLQDEFRQALQLIGGG
jgi:Colicin V production protein.